MFPHAVGCGHGQLVGASDRKHRPQSDGWSHPHLARRRRMHSRLAGPMSACRLARVAPAGPSSIRAHVGCGPIHPIPTFPPVTGKAFTSLPSTSSVTRRGSLVPTAPFPVSGGHTPWRNTELPTLRDHTPCRSIRCRTRAGRGIIPVTVSVAQLVEPLTVDQVVGGSSPLAHPSLFSTVSQPNSALFVARTERCRVLSRVHTGGRRTGHAAVSVIARRDDGDCEARWTSQKWAILCQ